ncbi:DUF4381 domain-containing protein [Rheinheimera riviphila]|uniref:DUF4381 domain-containing protein n=1 Tax=Rheinheimera riviphila TaxID=1834037 RepID=A0A437QSZ5_9GAMM|nr:DUF4381 domain-containing protein [Rheinheimera riviphila]RVU37637.1 DUF4381 domain-containing protein [Rheinheimera riviphila]
MANSNAANVAPPEAPIPETATMPGLADIQEPLLANDWYLAPGWSLLLVILVVLLGYAGYRWWRYQQQQKPIKFALAELEKLDLTAPNAAEMITTLLKRLLLTRLPAHPALALSGAAWQQYLMSSLPSSAKPVEPLPDLLALHYQSTPAVDDIRRYAAFAAVWLQKVKFTNTGAPDA